MKVLFDEGLPRKLARSLPQHEIHTVVSMHWGSIKNGVLLELRPFMVLVISAINWPVIRPHIQAISTALDEARPGTVRTIDCSVFTARWKRASE